MILAEEVPGQNGTRPEALEPRPAWLGATCFVLWLCPLLDLGLKGKTVPGAVSSDTVCWQVRGHLSCPCPSFLPPGNRCPSSWCPPSGRNGLLTPSPALIPPGAPWGPQWPLPGQISDPSSRTFWGGLSALAVPTSCLGSQGWVPLGCLANKRGQDWP